MAGFGDRIDYDYGNHIAHVIRNEKLKFKLQLDKLPTELMVAEGRRLPYGSMYDETIQLFPDVG